MTFYEKTRITFHRGSAYGPEGLDKIPFAVFTITDLVESELIDAVCTLVRDHTHKMHADFCNVKISTEQWDA